jgi:hypothetical protein
MNNCYKLETIIFNKGFLDDSTDATYILYLEGNGRYNKIINQLQKYQPTKKVYILHNKGYKKCKKKDFINSPPLDLVDAYLYVFNDANKKNYDNILILEDDFIFDDKINDKKITNKINKFLNKYKDKEIMYSLGFIPFIIVPTEMSHYLTIVAATTHSIIYNRNVRNKILKVKQETIDDWDHNKNRYTLYCYHEPLCYQLLPATENQKYWFNGGIMNDLALLFIQCLKLDKQVYPGYKIMYFISKIILPLIIIIIICLIFYFNKNRNKK